MSRTPWTRHLCIIFVAFQLVASQAFAAEIKLAAAASLKDALDTLKPELEKDLPGTRLTITLGASGTLQQQVIQGAPIDLFIAAAKKPMDALQAGKFLVDRSRQILLRNELVLIAPQKSSLSLRQFTDLTHPKVRRIALGEPRSVPAGDYTLQTLKKENLEAKLTSKFIYAKDVRQVLSYVERGEVDAGFVYASDLVSADKTKVKLITKANSASHDPIIYELAVIERKTNASRAGDLKKVTDYLTSAKALKIWTQFGFLEAGSKTAEKLKVNENGKGAASAPL